ncbi:hypothetical protein QM285_22510, partial [Stutzerimonas stutzeri]|nr:hypothetical protein [Stutzerimonas stutzeri]
ALNNGLQGFSDLGPAINELRGTLGALRRVTQRLEDNPSGFLLGRERAEQACEGKGAEQRKAAHGLNS